VLVDVILSVIGQGSAAPTAVEFSMMRPDISEITLRTFSCRMRMSTHLATNACRHPSPVALRLQVREIVRYAAERSIDVMPEIELPGHCCAALACYPELSCTGQVAQVPTNWGIHEDVYCAGSEQVFQFLDKVFAEVGYSAFIGMSCRGQDATPECMLSTPQVPCQPAGHQPAAPSAMHHTHHHQPAQHHHPLLPPCRWWSCSPSSISTSAATRCPRRAGSSAAAARSACATRAWLAARSCRAGSSSALAGCWLRAGARSSGVCRHACMMVPARRMHAGVAWRGTAALHA
jgi:hypothetical protein